MCVQGCDTMLPSSCCAAVDITLQKIIQANCFKETLQLTSPAGSG